MTELVEHEAETQPDAARIRWQIAPRWRAQLEPRRLRLDDWLRSGPAHVVKKSRHRTVYRIDLPEGRFYLKRYYPRGIARDLLDWLRGPASRREWRKSLLLAERGIATVRPVALGQVAGRVGSLFLTEELAGACPLTEFLTAQLADLPPDERGALRARLVVELARFIAAAHDAGVTHDDLHPGNVMLRYTADRGELELALIDLPGVSVGRKLTWRASRDNLVMLRASFEGLALPDEFLGFWKVYRGLRSDVVPADDAAALADIARRVAEYRRRLLSSRDKRCCDSNRDFQTIEAGKSRGYAVRAVDSQTLQQMVEQPERLLRDNLHRPVKLTRGTQLVEARLETNEGVLALAYKRYRSRNWWKLLVDQLRGSRARRSWKAGHALLARGIATPRPLLCIEPRRRVSAASYLGTTWIDNARNLHELAWELAWTAPAERARRVAACAESLGAVVGRLHAWRYSHRDLKACNLLIVEGAEGVTSYVVDLDGVQRRWWLSRRVIARNLSRLATSLSHYAWISRTQRWRFLRAYARAAQLGPDDVRWLWKQTARDTGRMMRRMRRRGRPVA